MSTRYYYIGRGDDPELPRSVKCPRCRAEPGESCHILGGDIISAPPMDPGPFVHLVRYDLAKRVCGEGETT